MTRHRRIITTTVAIILLSVRGAFAVENPPVEYLSDILNERLLLSTQGFGNLGIDTAVTVEGRTPVPLRIKDTEYKKGLGHHANGEILITLDGEYLTFEALVGVLWQERNLGTVVFQVFVDGEKRFDSGIMHEADPAKPLKVSVEGAQMLRLVATDAGDSIICDCANWAEARLTRNPKAKAHPAEAKLDIAPSATVATWDPHRKDGARADRVQEFHAEDVFLHTPVTAGTDGNYVVPLTADGVGCIGLQWIEKRRLQQIGLRFAGAPPPVAGVQLEQWVGDSWWQGNWEPLKGNIATAGDAWTFDIVWKDNPQIRGAGTQKVRWVFPKTDKPIAVKSLPAFTRSVWGTATVRIEAEGVHPGETGQIEVYNGALDGGGRAAAWDMSKPLSLHVHYSKPMPIKSDRTVLRFRLPEAPGRTATEFAVAVEDVLANPGVYIRPARVDVTGEPGGTSLAAYQREIHGRQTVLERVRQMPDQTFPQAMERVHNPVQNLGPMLLSLACDNRKFQTQRDGAIEWSTVPDDPASGWVNYPVELRPRFGASENKDLTRHLDGEWLPVPTIQTTDGVMVYRQRTFVAPIASPPTPLPAGEGRTPSVCVAEFTVTNTGVNPAKANLGISLMADAPKQLAAQMHKSGADWIATHEGRLLAAVSVEDVPALQVEANGGALTISGELDPKQTVRVWAYLPAWDAKPEDATFAGRGLVPRPAPGDHPAGYEPPPYNHGEALLVATRAYWEWQLASAMQVEIPDPLLANVIRASQVHCLLAARSEAEGERVAAWISSDRYGPLESEAHAVIRGMDEFGHRDYARRSLEFFIKRYNPSGYLTTGYTMMGTGWHLWTLAEHYRLTGDDTWLRQNAPEVARVCRWIAAQRQKTAGHEAQGTDLPLSGLVPPGVVADWAMYANRFYMDGNYCVGLREAARALEEVGQPDAKALEDDAEGLRQALVRGVRWNQSHSPVRTRQDGMSAPFCAGILECLGTGAEFYPSEDGARAWAGDVEIGPHNLVAMGLLDPNAPQVGWMMDDLEDNWCLATGMCDYPGDKNHADWFSRGGFPKVQPYYGRMTDVYALRDEVKPYIRSYFNAIPSLLSLENLSFWEHFHNTGGWNKTHETGGFLHQTRTMFVMERGKKLWLAPFVTNQWLQDGLVVHVHHAPTQFGDVSYRIKSSVAAGTIEAEINPPTRKAPDAIVIRLRHPEGKPMRSVTVNGHEHTDFDAAHEWVRVAPQSGAIRIIARY